MRVNNPYVCADEGIGGEAAAEGALPLRHLRGGLLVSLALDPGDCCIRLYASVLGRVCNDCPRRGVPCEWARELAVFNAQG